MHRSAKPDPARTPAAALLAAGAAPGHPAASRPVLWMRTSKSYSPVPLAHQTTTRSSNPSRAAVILVAAGKAPATDDVAPSLGANPAA